eukprot:6470705-Amphidinium_carterae.1
MILDCRQSNQCFLPPPSTSLFTGSSFGGMEMGADDGVFISAIDVQAAFYQHGLPRWLCPYFSMPTIKAKSLGVSEVDGRPVTPDTRIIPQVAVAPM